MRCIPVRALALVFLALCGSCSGQTWTGRCVGVADGDTIRVMHAGKAEKIRLYGIDCPERTQDFGTRARQFTSGMVFEKTVTVQPVDRDRYGRTVAWVSLEGKSVNRALLEAGLAWWYRQHAAKDRDLERLEQTARKQRIGLWSQPKPIPPWKFRREERKNP